MKNEPKIVCTPSPTSVTPSAVGYSSPSAPKPACAHRTKTVRSDAGAGEDQRERRAAARARGGFVRRSALEQRVVLARSA